MLKTVIKRIEEIFSEKNFGTHHQPPMSSTMHVRWDGMYLFGVKIMTYDVF